VSTAVRVVTVAGAVAGSEERHGGTVLNVFRGIPYAEPPVGPRRFRPPEAVAPWEGTRQAVVFGPAAPQPDPAPIALPSAAMVAGPRDEAGCLTLNVWSPAAGHRRPVLVWLHGGSFMTGSSSMASYDAAALAAGESVVVVSVNYRLGALGFAPLGGVTNIGLLDQVLALGWVRDNIEGFGGDPDLITMFGESAGGGSVLHLMAAPPCRGLVRRAICQSGATDLTLPLDEAEEVAERFRSALAGADPQTVPVAAILAAQDRVLAELASTRGLMPYHPAVDGSLIPAAPAAALAGGAAADTDLLIGTTADEMTLFLDGASWELGPDRFRGRATRYLARLGITGPAAGAIGDAYLDALAAPEAWSALRTDAEMWLPALAAADAHALGGRTFVYRFDWPAARPEGDGARRPLGACHGIDIPFTFGTLDRCGWGEFVGADEDAWALSRMLRTAWAAFAAAGDPSTEDLGAWPAYGAPIRPTMVLDRDPAVVDDPRGLRRRAWADASESLGFGQMGQERRPSIPK
jgi:para-nitrobenzyl esterase